MKAQDKPEWTSNRDGTELVAVMADQIKACEEQRKEQWARFLKASDSQKSAVLARLVGYLENAEESAEGVTTDEVLSYIYNHL